MDNQMEIFMDKENVLGEWLAYFENSRLCSGTVCKDGLNEMGKLSEFLDGKMRIAHINW